jgi:hypothetical protein
MAIVKRKVIRLVRMHVQQVTDPVQVEAKDWKGFSRTPFPGEVYYTIQPILVLDDGDTLEEVQHPAVRITAENWPEYSSKTFPAELRAWQRQLDAEQGNRQQRRTKKAT